MAIIYIAGPMARLTGFNLAELALVEQGHEVRNPACLGHGWANYEHYMEIVFLAARSRLPGAQREAGRAKTLCLESVTPLLREVWDALNVAYIANTEVGQ